MGGANSMDVKTVMYPLHADAAAGTLGFEGDAVLAHVLKVPASTDGGGITILRAYVVDQTGTTSGTSYKIWLLDYGTGGTANGGTIGYAGGTEDPFSAGVPKAMTLTDAMRFVSAGHWLVARKNETNSSDPSRGVLVIEYIAGK